MDAKGKSFFDVCLILLIIFAFTSVMKRPLGSNILNLDQPAINSNKMINKIKFHSMHIIVLKSLWRF